MVVTKIVNSGFRIRVNWSTFGFCGSNDEAHHYTANHSDYNKGDTTGVAYYKKTA